MSPRVAAGAEDIPLGNHIHHPIDTKGTPPSSDAAPPPRYINTYNPSPEAPSTTRKWYKQPFPIFLGIIVVIIAIVVILLVKVGPEHNRKAAVHEAGNSNDLSTTKIFGLAATECEAGTFVVWKVASGDFWWKGVLNNGEGEIPPQKVNQARAIANYTQPGVVDLTASCWFKDSGSLEIIFQFIYYDPIVFRTFISTNILINLPSGGIGSSIMPIIDSSTIREFDRKIEYNITSLGVVAVTPPPRTAKIRLNHLVYLVPCDLSKPDGPADVVYRPSIGDQWGWDEPQILDGTAKDANSSIAIASVDGGEYNSNATSVHVIFSGEQGTLMYLNWTESRNWSSANPIYTNSGVLYHLPSSPQKFTLAIPSTSQNRSIHDTPLTRRQFTLPPPSEAQNNSRSYYAPPAAGSIRLNLYFISPSSTAVPVANITTLSIAYDSNTNTMRIAGDSDHRIGGPYGSTSLVAGFFASPAYLAAAAYNPFFLQNNYTQASSGQIENNQTAKNTWMERVQLIFVETDDAALQNGRIANITFQKAVVGGNAWSYRPGDVVVADIKK